MGRELTGRVTSLASEPYYSQDVWWVDVNYESYYRSGLESLYFQHYPTQNDIWIGMRIYIDEDQWDQDDPILTTSFIRHTNWKQKRR